MKRAFVTGATGFLGLHLVRRLAADGWTVVAPVRATSAAERVAKVRAAGAQTEVLGDRSDAIAGAVARARPDVVFHLATHFVAQHKPGDIEGLVQSNVLFGAQLLEGLNNVGGGKIVSMGTNWQQFENRPYSPLALYAATKQAFDALLQFYTEVGAVRSQSLLLTDSYGPDDPRRKIIAVLRDAERTGNAVELTGGEQRVDLVHAFDVVDALLAASARFDGAETARVETVRAEPARAERWAVRTGRSITIRELASVFQAARGVTFPVRIGTQPYRAREVFVPWTAEQTLPGWAPRISLEEGLRTLDS